MLATCRSITSGPPRSRSPPHVPGVVKRAARGHGGAPGLRSLAGVVRENAARNGGFEQLSRRMILLKGRFLAKGGLVLLAVASLPPAETGDRSRIDNGIMAQNYTNM